MTPHGISEYFSQISFDFPIFGAKIKFHDKMLDKICATVVGSAGELSPVQHNSSTWRSRNWPCYW